MLGDGGSQVGVIGDLDVALMRDNLDNIAARLEAVRQVDLDAVIHQMQQVRDALPQLQEEDMGRSVRLINSYIAGQVIPGEKIDLLVDDAVSPREAERAVQEELDNEYISVLSTPAGVVRPNTRAELFRVLREVRGIIAGLAAIVFTVLTLILDHATILSAGRRLLAGKKGLRRVLNPVFVFGALTGAALLVPTYILSRANIPFMGLGQALGCGLLLGLLTALLAERLSPVDDSEMLAGGGPRFDLRPDYAGDRGARGARDSCSSSAAAGGSSVRGDGYAETSELDKTLRPDFGPRRLQS